MGLNPSLLRKKAKGWGASLVGFADLQGVAQRELARWPRAISIALALDPQSLKGVERGPTPEYYNEYLRANATLNIMAEKTAEYLLNAGYGAQPLPATIAADYAEPDFERSLSVPFQHKTAATRAGLGFIGKSGLLITSAYGPRLRLVTVFTDMPLPTGTPVTEGRCGPCRLCVEACPAQAIRGREWRVGTTRERLLDAHACRAQARQLLKEQVRVDDAVCGVCIAVCPQGEKERSLKDE